MCLGTGGAQPIPKIVGWILIEIDQIGNAAIDRKKARTGRTGVSHSSRRPAEQVLRPKICRKGETGSKAHDLVNFVLSGTLRVEIARVGRSAKQIRRSRIECNNSI